MLHVHNPICPHGIESHELHSELSASLGSFDTQNQCRALANMRHPRFIAIAFGAQSTPFKSAFPIELIIYKIICQLLVFA